LTAADTVIHYDPWWNPAAEAQATDRAYRIGQTKPVFVHKLICTDSVEERIQKLQAEKSKLADGLLAGTNKATAPDEDTLRQLLAPI
ncbi:MAG: C-terminal helicase domain-containing protein, partial [Roseibacillus sp.]